MRPDLWPALILSNGNWSLLFSAVGWTEQHNVCATNGEKEEKGKYSLETGTGAGSHDVKEEDIVDENELAASSALRKREGL